MNKKDEVIVKKRSINKILKNKLSLKKPNPESLFPNLDRTFAAKVELAPLFYPIFCSASSFRL